MRFAINGSIFLREKKDGEKRYAEELINSLDKICSGMDIELIVSKKSLNIPDLKNIKIVKFGNLGNKNLWEQTYFSFYAIFKNRMPISLGSITSLLKPGISALHDTSFLYRKECENLTSRIVVYWHIFHSWHISKFAKKIITVSKFSKNEIIKHYKTKSSRIIVIPNAWQHISCFSTTLAADADCEYFFALSSVKKNKNFKWILEVAKRNPEQKFKIAGSFDFLRFGEKLDTDKPLNVEFLGYVSDEEAKILMQNAKAFLFPSFYEGFGIPPMESLALGTPVIVSDIPVMHEVYENSAHYIDPCDYEVDLGKILAEEVEPAERVLDRYSWEKSAGMLKNLLEAYAGIA